MFSSVFWLYGFVWLGFVLCLTFYGLRSPWWRSAVGRALFTLYASLTAVLTLVLLALMGFVPGGLWPVLRTLTLGAVGVAGWIQLANILHFQRQDRRRSDEELAR